MRLDISKAKPHENRGNEQQHRGTLTRLQVEASAKDVPVVNEGLEVLADVALEVRDRSVRPQHALVDLFLAREEALFR